MSQKQNFTPAQVLDNIRKLEEISIWFNESKLFQEQECPFTETIKETQQMLKGFILEGFSASIETEEDNEDLEVRICSVTGEEMSSGWCANDGMEYFKYEKDAVQWCISNGYKNMQEAYDDDAIYWTEWS